MTAMSQNQRHQEQAEVQKSFEKAPTNMLSNNSSSSSVSIAKDIITNSDSRQAPHLDEHALDETISKILQAVHSSTDLHSLDELDNITLENKMDNSLSQNLRKSNLSRSTIDVPGQTTSKISPNGLINDLNSKLVIVMVGLPARGKSYLTKKITRYMNWLQYNTKIFNVGNTRRLSKQNQGPADRPFEMPETPSSVSTISSLNKDLDHGDHDASFFDPKNQSSLLIREQWAMNTLDQLIKYLMKEDGTVGIFDATNTTKLRRRHIIEAIRAKTPANSNLKILFLESICTDKRMIHRNMKLKLSGPDYKDKDPVLALKDFRNRLNNYEKAYETIDEEEEEYYETINENLQYIKIFNAGKKITSYNISGFLSSQVIFFMLNFNLNERQIWISRHGETYDNLNGKLGCSKQGSKLTPLGERYSQCLARFMNFKKKEFRLRQLKKHYIDESYLDEETDDEHNSKAEKEKKKKNIIPELHFSVWSSMLKQTVQTSNSFSDQNFNIKQIKMLNELSHGKVNGMTLKRFASKFPADFKKYQNIYQTDDHARSSRKKLLYRFPGGESYLDVINRLRPLIVELERMEDHVLLITHKVVARVLLSYFMNLDKEYITELDVPLHSVYVLEPRPYGVDWNMYQYDAEVDWFFPVNKDKILRKKKKREVIPAELIDLYSSNLLKKKQTHNPRTNFYIESPSEPSTPKRSYDKSKVNFAEIDNIIFAKSEDNSVVGDSETHEEPEEESYSDGDSDSDSEQEDDDDDDENNEHWYKYQLDNGVYDEENDQDENDQLGTNNSSDDEMEQKGKNKNSPSSSCASPVITHGFESRNDGEQPELLTAQKGLENTTFSSKPSEKKKLDSSSDDDADSEDDYHDNKCTKFNSCSSSSINFNTPNTLSVNNSDVNLKLLPSLAKFSSLNKQLVVESQQEHNYHR